MKKDIVPPPKKGKTWLSKTIAWIHLWPSLISGVLLVFICLTGTIIVYCDEIIDFASRDARYVPEVKSTKLPIETLIANYKKAYPKRKNPSYIVAYKDPARSVKMNSFEPKTGLSFVFMDPYTGKILKEDRTIHFFFITAHLHSMLLWHGVGDWIVDIGTIIFLIELITGLVLWWPVKWTKATRDASFKVKWKASFKRLNYDLHNVVGFFGLSIAIILTLTGLIIAFEPLASLTLTTFGGNSNHKAVQKNFPGFKSNQPSSPLGDALNKAFAKYPDKSQAQLYTFTIDSAGFYTLVVANRIGLKSADSPEYFFVDRVTGQEVSQPQEAQWHEQIENGYWSLHMGTWLGPIGKFLTFVGGIICTSLPITGFLIWWNRRKKKPLTQRKTSSRAKPIA
ncbi:MAG: PepSY-associated TM helix domain-containing protein [Siphonobacter sp.]